MVAHFSPITPAQVGDCFVAGYMGGPCVSSRVVYGEVLHLALAEDGVADGYFVRLTLPPRSPACVRSRFMFMSLYGVLSDSHLSSAVPITRDEFNDNVAKIRGGR